MRAASYGPLLGVLLAALASGAAPRCPDGTVASEDDGKSWCLRSGVLHGPFECRHPDRSPVLRGAYAEGAPAGSWTGFDEAGRKRWEGSFATGGARASTRQLDELLAGSGFRATVRSFERTLCTSRTLVSGWNIGMNMHLGGDTLRRMVYTIPAGVPAGTWTVWHENGTKLSEGRFEGGARTGVWRTWHPSGALSDEGRFEGGVKKGTWRGWHPSGQPRLEVHFAPAGKVVESRQWDESGRLVRSVRGGLVESWKGDELRRSRYGAKGRHGPEERYVGGLLVERAEYRDDRLDGTRTVFFRAGPKRSEETYRAGVRDGPARDWYETGELLEEGAWRSGARHGTWRGFYPNGKPRFEHHYENGKLHGPWLRWREDGRVWEEGSYREGKQDGRWRSYWMDGRLESERVLADETGEWTSRYWFANGVMRWEVVREAKGSRTERQWWPDGTLRSEESYRDDEPEGAARGWHQNGKPSYERYYEGGKKTGTWRSWYSDGLLEDEAHWEAGRQVGSTKQHPRPPERRVGLWDILRSGRRGLWPWQLRCDPGTRPVEERDLAGGTARGCITPDGERVGRWVDRYASGKLRFERSLVEGRAASESRAWYENGQPASIHRFGRDGTQEGPFTEWFDSGRVRREGRYRDGHLEGRVVSRHPNGLLETEEEYDTQGRRVRWTRYGPEGQLEVMGELRPDGRRAVVSEYDDYSSGFLRTRYETRGETRHGPLTVWKSDGCVVSRGQMFEGKKEGRWSLYDNDCRILRYEEYWEGEKQRDVVP